MAAVVGFDRKIKREWLDTLVDRVGQGQDTATLRTYLHGTLQKEHPGATARGKTVTVLMRIWALVPEEHEDIREQALDMLKSIPAADRIWLHWGMCLLAYPLFRDIATTTGRLLKLQDEYTLAQLERRVVAIWGERSTVIRACQRVVRSMIEWNMIADSEEPGHFHPMPLLTTPSKPVQLWLLRASHIADGQEMIEAAQLLNLPSLFPFKISVGKVDLRRSRNFTVHRQGLDMDMVAISNEESTGTSEHVDGKRSPKQVAMFDNG